MKLWTIVIITVFLFICDSKLDVSKPSPEETDKLLEITPNNSTTESLWRRNFFRTYTFGKRRPGK